MTTQNFLLRVQTEVAKYLNNYHHYNATEKYIFPSNVFIVWSCKTLQNYKAVAAAYSPDQFLFEVTYNGDKQEFYIDVYDKKENIKIEQRIHDEV